MPSSNHEMVHLPRRHATLILALVVVAITSVCFCIMKDGFFHDEFYSYGLANSAEVPFIIYLHGIDEQVYTHQEFVNYLTAQAHEELAGYGAVLVNQALDVHPPLYYLLLHTISLLVPDGFSKWIGLSVNLPMHLVTVWLLYRLVNEVFRNEKFALITAVLYGMSAAGISTLILIRMYALETMLTMLLANLLWALYERQTIKRCVWAGVVIFLGLMTLYYYVFYAFFACLAYVVYLAKHRRYRAVVLFSGCALAGVALFFICWPFVFSQMRGGQTIGQQNASMGETTKRLASSTLYVSQVAKLLAELVEEAPLSVPVVLVGVCVVVESLTKKWRVVRVHHCCCDISDAGGLIMAEQPRLCVSLCLLVIPAIITFLIVAIVRPLEFLRYAYQVIPIFPYFSLGYVYIFIAPIRSKVASSTEMVCTAGAVAVALICLAVSGPVPHYLHPRYVTAKERVESHSSLPCIYVFDPNKVAHFSCQTELLLAYDEVFLTTRQPMHADAMEKYLKAHATAEKVVVYVSGAGIQDEMGCDQLVLQARTAAQIAEKGGYSRCEEVAHYERTSIWELSGRQIEP